FARDTTVPRPVQEFAWRVIETRCNYQRYEREQRSFWAYNAQATKVDGGVTYSIDILSDLPWKQTLPSALIAMTIVEDGSAGVTYSMYILSDLPWKQTLPSALIEMTIVDDGRLRLTALKSSFVNCEF